MQIIINIDDGLVERLKGAVTRKRAAFALMIFVILASALLFAATKPHTFVPGTTISSSRVNENFDAAFEAIGKAVPPGTVLAYAGSTVPEGFLLCDGSSASRTEYAELFSAIGTTYGTGDGSTTFNIPDYRGVFLRGHHYGSTKDPEYTTRNLGTLQNHMFEDHTHDLVKASDHNFTATGHALIRYNSSANEGTTSIMPSNGNHGTETRPVNRSVSYIIKY